MPDNTTPDTDNTSQDNWEQRYKGLQKVVAQRDEALNTLESDRDRLRAEHEAASQELASYRQERVDAQEEEQARQQYEALRERFEEHPPEPVGNNARRPMGSERRGWEEGSAGPYDRRPRNGTSQGFPT